VNRLAPSFAARIDGADITRPLDDAIGAEIRAAFDEHSVLVFHGQPMDDEAQIAFSRRFGALEVTRSINPAAGTPFARRSNVHAQRRREARAVEACCWAASIASTSRPRNAFLSFAASESSPILRSCAASSGRAAG